MEVQGGNDGGVAAGGLCRLQPLPHLHLLQQLLLAVARQFDHPSTCPGAPQPPASDQPSGFNQPAKQKNCPQVGH